MLFCTRNNNFCSNSRKRKTTLDDVVDDGVDELSKVTLDNY